MAHGATGTLSEDWIEAVPEARAAYGQARAEGQEPAQAAHSIRYQFEREYPVAWDWLLQDLGQDWAKWLESDREADVERSLLEAVGVEQFPDAPFDDPIWLHTYHEACLARRAQRLEPLLATHTRFVFARHFNMGASHYAYTEALSDARNERSFVPGSALCILVMDGIEGQVTTLLEDPDGVIRNPDVSYDGQRVLFSWKQSDREDDYSLYEMDLDTGAIRTLLEAEGHADYEAIYLPTGDIMFNSTRCVQIVDCWWTEVSNLYLIDSDGGSLRRISFDQVHTNFPMVLEDGRVIYTRWDYNDRGQIFPQGLFEMNPDGTAQMEYYGNNSYFPTTLIHARGIPGTEHVMAIFTGHHSFQAGKLGIIDTARGRQENEGAQLIAPIRETPAERIDAYGQDGDLFQYPYPISADEFIVTYHPLGWDGDRFTRPTFKLYFMTADGRRELLAADPERSSNQAVPLEPRPIPHQQPSQVDYRQDTGVYYVQDVYEGPGLEGVIRGTIEELRVVALEYRPAGIGSNTNAGPAGGALVSTPIAIGNGSWDVKHILGSATVHEDGSAIFQVPARTPVYFQALDGKGQAVQTMRSWSTLQPGERLSCVGCHDDKNEAPPVLGGTTLAMRRGIEELQPFHEISRGFSFAKDIQPILDRHCIECHNDSSQPRPGSIALAEAGRESPIAPTSEWRYTLEEPGPGWEQESFDDSDWDVGRGGFGLEGTPGGPIHTPWPNQTIWLRRSFDLPADMDERRFQLQVAHDEDVRIYINGVLAASADGYVTHYVPMTLTREGREALRPGENTIAVSCLDTAGGRYIDVALHMGAPRAAPDSAFSLLGEPVHDGAAKRYWSEAYLALTAATEAGEPGSGHDFRGMSNELVNWISAQSVPPMLPPYHAGAAQSELLPMLRGGHEGVALDDHELRTLAAWIDLLVPFCGDYAEAHAWSEDEQAEYDRLVQKRREMEAIEKAGIAEFIARHGTEHAAGTH